MSSRWVLSDNAERPPSVRTDAWDGFCQGLKCLDNAAADIAKAGKLFADISEPQWNKLRGYCIVQLDHLRGSCPVHSIGPVHRRWLFPCGFWANDGF